MLKNAVNIRDIDVLSLNSLELNIEELEQRLELATFLSVAGEESEEITPECWIDFCGVNVCGAHWCFINF